MFVVGSVVKCRVCGYVGRVSTLYIGDKDIQHCSKCLSNKIEQEDIMIK